MLPHCIRFWRLLFFLLPASAGAQVMVEGGILPPDVTEEAIARANDPAAIRLPGGTRIPAERRVEGSVAVMGGGIELLGVIVGDLFVLNGDARIGEGGRVEGEVLIVGGTLQAEPGSAITGAARVFIHPLRVRMRAGVVEAVPEAAFAPGFLASDLGFGQARVTVRAGTAYNRVEGLPVQLGPVIQTPGSNPVSLEMLAIWRSVNGFELASDELGYVFRLEQGLGGRGTAFLGASAYREVREIESRGMSDLESSLSTLFLRRDLRDYYAREGWSGYLRLRPARMPVRLLLTYREEENASAVVESPWTLGGSLPLWRPLPLVAEGPRRSLEAELLWDATDDPALPTDGWWLALGVERQVGGSLRIPEFTAGTPGETVAEGARLPSFARGSIDLRRYARVSPTSRLNLRLAASGTLTESSLPPQLQTTLGGEGTLPGHRSFAVDCGARATLATRTPAGDADGAGPTYFPSYGCDRTLLFQAEFQGFLPFAWRPFSGGSSDSELTSLLELRPIWAVFFDAGRGWAIGEERAAVARLDAPTLADAGVGLFLGPLGLYWSYPLNRRDRGVNFFVRLQHRF